MTGGAARHRFNHDDAERLRPVDGNEQPDRATEEVRFFMISPISPM